MSFITILDDESQPFQWQYTDGNGQKTETVFTLQILDSETEERLKAKHRKVEYIQHQPHTTYPGYTDDMIDHVIVNWSKLYARKSDGTLVEVECTRARKLALPDRLRARIIELTVGKEAAMSEGLLDSKSMRS